MSVFARSSFIVSMYFLWCLPWCSDSVSAEITGASASSAYGSGGNSKCSRDGALAVAVVMEILLRGLDAKVVLQRLDAAHLLRGDEGTVHRLLVLDESRKPHDAATRLDGDVGCSARADVGGERAFHFGGKRRVLAGLGAVGLLLRHSAAGGETQAGNQHEGGRPLHRAARFPRGLPPPARSCTG